MDVLHIIWIFKFLIIVLSDKDEAEDRYVKLQATEKLHQRKVLMQYSIN